MENKEAIDKYFTEMNEIIGKIDRGKIDEIIEMLFEAWENGNTIYCIGNGGSASTATHFAADLSKTTMVKGKKRFKAMSLVDNIPLVSAWINDEGYENVYTGQLENWFQKGDVVIGFSVHGGSGEGNAGAWSQNLPKAMQYAKDNGGKAIGFSGFDGGAMAKLADACIVVPFESTPQVEAFHVVLHHLIIFRLKEKIVES